MDAFVQPVYTRRLLITAYLLTVPTVLFWLAVAVSVITHNHRYVDVVLELGSFSHVLIAFVLPFTSFIIALICRVSLRQQAIAKNIWHRETQEMKVNQGLMNWCMILMAVMIISLINN
ncbi:MAG: hypothetical protein ACHQD9_00020 [Chitinophagales bacterium]